MNVTVYVNGKRVTKKEIEKIEIQNENVKRIILEVLQKKRGSRRLSHSSNNHKSENIK